MASSASTVQVAQSSSGLTLVGEPMPYAHGCSIVLLVKTGSSNELKPKGESGISHFLEHMAFKGTDSFSAMEHTMALGTLGAQVNAYTSDEQTVYYGTVMGEHFEALHELLFEMMRPALLQEDFDMEKNVILEEIALYKDRPGHVLYEHAVHDFFGGKGVGNSVLGTTESVSAITRDLMASYVNRRYAHGNIVAAATGNFPWERFVELSEAQSAKWSPLEDTNRLGEGDASEIVAGDPALTSFTHPKCGGQSHVLFLSSAPIAKDERRYASLLTANVLGDSHNSRLYWKLVESGLAEYVSVDPEEKREVGCLMTHASMPAERLSQVYDTICEEFSFDNPVTEDELEIAKSKLLSRMVMDRELPLGRAMSHVVCQQYRAEQFDLQQEMDAVKAVKAKDCMAFLEEFPFQAFRAYAMQAEKS